MRFLFLVLILLSTASVTARAEVRAVTEDGRSVLLKDDGTYEYLEPTGEGLDEALARALITKHLEKTERTMTGASCLQPGAYTIEAIDILERTDTPEVITVVAEVTIKAQQRMPSSSSWDPCFEFAFQRSGANPGDVKSGRLQLVFRTYASQWLIQD